MDYLNFRTAACEVNMVALTACLGKAKKVLDASGGLNSEKILELEKKRKTLKDMFVRWEETWKETWSANNNDDPPKGHWTAREGALHVNWWC